jgi:hypothetical protein
MDELMTTAATGDRDAQEVAADLHEQRGLGVTAAALRLNARGYAFPPHLQGRLQALGFCVHQEAQEHISQRIVYAMLRELREAEETALRMTEITVYCTGCGMPRCGPRAALAKFRKCCDTSTKERKFCRCCGNVLKRERYLAQEVHGGVQGWKTLANCELCSDRPRPTTIDNHAGHR